MFVTQQLFREALAPYRNKVVLVSGEALSWSGEQTKKTESQSEPQDGTNTKQNKN